MRSIRYRAWDKEEKKMLYNVEHTYDGYIVPMASFGGILDCPNFYDVMQYTGIKDIYSNRVFESDIVKIVLTQGNGTYIGKVIYSEDDACFLVETTEGDYFTFVSDDIKSVEVLGNIYESKELLNA
ncbi:YopX family protein [Campylobacter concisus]